MVSRSKVVDYSSALTSKYPHFASKRYSMMASNVTHDLEDVEKVLLVGTKKSNTYKVIGHVYEVLVVSRASAQNYSSVVDGSAHGSAINVTKPFIMVGNTDIIPSGKILRQITLNGSVPLAEDKARVELYIHAEKNSQIKPELRAAIDAKLIPTVTLKTLSDKKTLFNVEVTSNKIVFPTNRHLIQFVGADLEMSMGIAKNYADVVFSGVDTKSRSQKLMKISGEKPTPIVPGDVLTHVTKHDLFIVCKKESRTNLTHQDPNKRIDRSEYIKNVDNACAMITKHLKNVEFTSFSYVMPLVGNGCDKFDDPIFLANKIISAIKQSGIQANILVSAPGNEQKYNITVDDSTHLLTMGKDSDTNGSDSEVSPPVPVPNISSMDAFPSLTSKTSSPVPTFCADKPVGGVHESWADATDGKSVKKEQQKNVPKKAASKSTSSEQPSLKTISEIKSTDSTSDYLEFPRSKAIIGECVDCSNVKYMAKVAGDGYCFYNSIAFLTKKYGATGRDVLTTFLRKIDEIRAPHDAQTLPGSCGTGIQVHETAMKFCALFDEKMCIHSSKPEQTGYVGCVLINCVNDQQDNGDVLHMYFDVDKIHVSPLVNDGKLALETYDGFNTLEELILDTPLRFSSTVAVIPPVCDWIAVSPIDALEASAYYNVAKSSSEPLEVNDTAELEQRGESCSLESDQVDSSVNLPSDTKHGASFPSVPLPENVEDKPKTTELAEKDSLVNEKKKKEEKLMTLQNEEQSKVTFTTSEIEKNVPAVATSTKNGSKPDNVMTSTNATSKVDEDSDEEDSALTRLRNKINRSSMLVYSKVDEYGPETPDVSAPPSTPELGVPAQVSNNVTPQHMASNSKSLSDEEKKQQDEQEEEANLETDGTENSTQTTRESDSQVVNETNGPQCSQKDVEPVNVPPVLETVIDKEKGLTSEQNMHSDNEQALLQPKNAEQSNCGNVVNGLARDQHGTNVVEENSILRKMEQLSETLKTDVVSSIETKITETITLALSTYMKDQFTLVVKEFKDQIDLCVSEANRQIKEAVEQGISKITSCATEFNDKIVADTNQLNSQIVEVKQLKLDIETTAAAVKTDISNFKITSSKNDGTTELHSKKLKKLEKQSNELIEMVEVLIDKNEQSNRSVAYALQRLDDMFVKSEATLKELTTKVSSIEKDLLPPRLASKQGITETMKLVTSYSNNYLSSTDINVYRDEDPEKQDIFIQSDGIYSMSEYGRWRIGQGISLSAILNLLACNDNLLGACQGPFPAPRM